MFTFKSEVTRQNKGQEKIKTRGGINYTGNVRDSRISRKEFKMVKNIGKALKLNINTIKEKQQISIKKHEL